jgi:hypothetical protein
MFLSGCFMTLSVSGLYGFEWKYCRWTEKDLEGNFHDLIEVQAVQVLPKRLHSSINFVKWEFLMRVAIPHRRYVILGVAFQKDASNSIL